MIKISNNVVVISPHPDDETLGLGGTIAKFNDQNHKTSILIVSGHLPPLYKKNDFLTTKKESLKAFKILGVQKSKFLEIPATKIHEIPIADLNSKILNF